MSDEKQNNELKQALATLATPEGVQRYILGTKKNGSPRAVFDVVKYYTGPKKKKKKKNKSKDDGDGSMYSFYLGGKTGKKHKKKKKKNKVKYWHI